MILHNKLYGLEHLNFKTNANYIVIYPIYLN